MASFLKVADSGAKTEDKPRGPEEVTRAMITVLNWISSGQMSTPMKMSIILTTISASRINESQSLEHLIGRDLLLSGPEGAKTAVQIEQTPVIAVLRIDRFEQRWQVTVKRS